MHHHFPSPYPPLPTIRSRSHPHPPAASDTSSPPSSRTTSPPASPTSTLRRRHQPSQVSPHHLFNLSFHPKGASDPGSSSLSDLDDHLHSHGHDHITGHLLSSNHSSALCGVTIPSCTVLRGRSSLMVVRRRPSAVDLALSEERYRCDENAIERQGLDLMEPRPVDMNLPVRLDGMNVGSGFGMRMGRDSSSRASTGSESRPVSVQQPRFVMGGIFEVMEGRG